MFVVFRENGLEDTVKLLKGRMEDVDLPVDKVRSRVKSVHT